MREVAVIDAEYRARGHDGDTLTEATLAWAVAEGHPLHRFCAGNRDALGACPAALQRALRAYHQCCFHTANMTLWLQGPQSEQALRAIAVAFAPTLAVRPPGHLPAGPPPLNWRLAGPLTLRCPGMLRLVLAFAVTDMAAGASAPLPLFRQLLQDEATGSLLDHLRVRGLCDGVRLLPCYQNADQGIVALVFSLLPGGVTRGGEIAALLLRWLAQLDARAPLQLSIAADLPGRAVISQGFSLWLGDDGAIVGPPSGAPSGHSHATAAGLKTELPPPPDPAFHFFPFPAPKAPVLQPDRAVRLRYLPAARRTVAAPADGRTLERAPRLRYAVRPAAGSGRAGASGRAAVVPA